MMIGMPNSLREEAHSEGEMRRGKFETPHRKLETRRFTFAAPRGRLDLRRFKFETRHRKLYLKRFKFAAPHRKLYLRHFKLAMPRGKFESSHRLFETCHCKFTTRRFTLKMRRMRGVPARNKQEDERSIRQEDCVMKFPKREADIKALARKIIKGLQENPYFPSPPVSSSELQNQLDTVDSQSDAQVAAYAAAEQITDSKHESIDTMIASMRAILDYAEYAAEDDDAKLSMLGWGARSPQTPPTAPGQARLFEVMQQGAGWVLFDWKRPTDGGLVSYYLIQRRDRAEGDWVTAGTSIETEARLQNLERGEELEFCVIAVNRAGEGPASNSVTVEL